MEKRCIIRDPAPGEKNERDEEVNPARVNGHHGGGGDHGEEEQAEVGNEVDVASAPMHWKTSERTRRYKRQTI